MTAKLTVSQRTANTVAAIRENSLDHASTMADFLATPAAFERYCDDCAAGYYESEPARYSSSIGPINRSRLYRELTATFSAVVPRVMLQVALVQARAAHNDAYNAHAKAVLALNLFDGEAACTSLVHPQPALRRVKVWGFPQGFSPDFQVPATSSSTN